MSYYSMTTKDDRDEDMKAFDDLPPKVRRLLSQMNDPFCARSVRDQISEHGISKVIWALEHTK